MKALVYDGPGGKTWTDVPAPTVREPEDAIVRVEATTICGTDLHILQGDLPEVERGRILGHEAVGTVVDVGAHVREIQLGQRVLVSCIASCGRCSYCQVGRFGQCVRGGGWVLGHTIDGTQAELVRVPYADRTLHPVPASVASDHALMFADIMPTAYEVGVLAGQVSPGDTVVIVGAGPIGLAAVITAQLFSPAHLIVVDPATERRELALQCGADRALDPHDDVAAVVHALGDGHGVHVAIEAVGLPETFEQCLELVRPTGRVANVGVHGKPATLHLESLWSRDITITTGLVDTYSTPLLLRLLAQQRIDVQALCTHRFALAEIQDAYEVFASPLTHGALKVVLFADAIE